MNVTVYHNPKCSKSRGVLEILDEKNIKYKIVKYTENPPSEEILKDILAKLELQPSEILRKKEGTYQSYKDKSLTEDEILSLLAREPILIERPIVVVGDKAVIARPPERVLKIL